MTHRSAVYPFDKFYMLIAVVTQDRNGRKEVSLGLKESVSVSVYVFGSLFATSQLVSTVRSG